MLIIFIFFFVKFVGFDIIENLNKKVLFFVFVNFDIFIVVDFVLFELSFGVLFFF